MSFAQWSGLAAGVAAERPRDPDGRRHLWVAREHVAGGVLYDLLGIARRHPLHLVAEARIRADAGRRCEMKANMTYEKFALLARGGFREVQPGIESFNSAVLRKMHKGVTATQNVYTPMLGRRFDVRILYNILFGFPSDEPGEYDSARLADAARRAPLQRSVDRRATR